LLLVQKAFKQDLYIIVLLEEAPDIEALLDACKGLVG
jgi:hypothetical protein